MRRPRHHNNNNKGNNDGNRVYQGDVWRVAAVGLTAGAADKGTAEQAVAMVKKGGDYLRKHGKDRAFAEFNNPKGQFVDRDLYLFTF